MSVVITINQLTPLANRPEINFGVMQRVVADNTALGSQLVIFPEDFLFGVMRDRAGLVEAAEQFEDWIIRLCGLARKYRTAIVPGTIPSLHNSLLHNTAVYIDNRGRIRTSYAKNNLWLSERDEYQPSLLLPEVFDSVIGKASLMICWDIMDHRLFEAVVARGAEWVIVPSFWSINQAKDMALSRGTSQHRYPGYTDAKLLDVLIRSRVAEYNIGLVFCNFGGKHAYQGLSGLQYAVSANRSQVVMPYLRVVGRLTSSKQAILRCDIEDISPSMIDYEIHYGRRADIIQNYPWRLE